MAHLLYFVDGPMRMSPDQVRELGLGYAFPAGFQGGDYTGAGPGGTQGFVLSAGERVGYYPDKQTWQRLPDTQFPRKQPGVTGVHVGCWNDSRPTPAELQVEQPLRGIPVRLRDGQDWTIPIARAWSDEEGSVGWANALPGVLRLDEHGDWCRGGVEPRYARLWEIATAWWTAILQAPPDPTNTVRFDFAGASDAAVEVLAANYRLRRAEVALLSLLDDQYYCAVQILDVLVDRATFLNWVKKNMNPATSPTPVG